MEPEQELAESEREVQIAQLAKSKRNGLLRYHTAIAGVIILVAVILRSQRVGKLTEWACTGRCGMDRAHLPGETGESAVSDG